LRSGPLASSRECSPDQADESGGTRLAEPGKEPGQTLSPAVCRFCFADALAAGRQLSGRWMGVRPLVGPSRRAGRARAIGGVGDRSPPGRPGRLPCTTQAISRRDGCFEPSSPPSPCLAAALGPRTLVDAPLAAETAVGGYLQKKPAP